MRLAITPAPSIRRAIACLLLLTLQVALAQISVPTFGARGVVAPAVIDSFMTAFRAQVGTPFGTGVVEATRFVAVAGTSHAGKATKTQ